MDETGTHQTPAGIPDQREVPPVEWFPLDSPECETQTTCNRPGQIGEQTEDRSLDDWLGVYVDSKVKTVSEED